MAMKVVLRDYQDTAVHDIRLAFRQHKRVILVLATGAGKTVVFSHIALSAATKGRRVLILAHRDQLIKQASRKLNDNNLRHGIIMAGYTPDYAASVQLASVQTLVRRLDKIRFKPDLIIIDECHLSAAASYLKVLEAFQDALVLGVTGSPCRLDNKPLGREFGGVYDFMVTGISIRQLIERGFLVRPSVYAPVEQIDLSGIKKSMGDYKTDELAAVVDKPKLIGDAVDQYQKICPGVPAVAWCVTVQHAQHVADEFNARGINAVMLCGDHDTAYRDDTLKKLATGEVQVVTFVGILVEGVDVPEIGAVLMLRPTMSLASYLQVIGRGLRPAPGKDCCYVLDHAGLSFKHGLADEEREWSLDWGEKKKKGKKKEAEAPVDVIQCKGCYAVFSPDAGRLAATVRTIADPTFSAACCCPGCGKVVETKARKLEQQDGELQEITPEMAERMRKNKQREVHSARTLEDLLRVAAQRGYSAGWAQQVFNSRARKQEKEQEAIIAARVEKMITVFAKYNVTLEMLEAYLTHDVKLVNEKELENLTAVFNKIKTGTPVTEFFTINGEDEKPVF
ncbi:type I restriction enzyme EcoKI subunit R [compost metagenome]